MTKSISNSLSQRGKITCEIELTHGSKSIENIWLSQTLFGNPKKPVELGNPNTCAETKLCLILFYSGSRSSLAMNLKLLYS